ncbi:MAG: ankyrin repeat domain-containing protein [Phycisphaerae bacterium]|nr:ankyrin repeat domain-containing protein [Phycisphaerae bacterium]
MLNITKIFVLMMSIAVFCVSCKNDKLDTSKGKNIDSNREKDDELYANKILTGLDNGKTIEQINAPKDERKITLLHLAAMKNLSKTASLLLGNGVNVNCVDSHGASPLGYAAGGADLNMVKLLIKNGAIYNKSDFDAPIHSAASSGKTDVVEFFLENGVEIEETCDGGFTPLHCAASSGKYKTVKFLLEKGADVNAKIEGGRTPLAEARIGYLVPKKDMEKTIEILKEYGAED